MTVVLGTAPLALVLAHDEDAVHDDHGHDREEYEEDHAHRDVAGSGHVALGHGGDIVGVADLAHMAVQILAGKNHPRVRAVLEVGYVDAAIDGVGAHKKVVRMVLNQVIPAPTRRT